MKRRRGRSSSAIRRCRWCASASRAAARTSDDAYVGGADPAAEAEDAEEPPVVGVVDRGGGAGPAGVAARDRDEATIWQPQWAPRGVLEPLGIPRDLRDGHGDPQLADQGKRKIPGQDLPELHGMDVEETRGELVPA